MSFQLDNIPKTTFQKTTGVDVASILKKEITFFGSGNAFSNKIKEDFYTELSVLLNAGINLKSAIELIEANFKKKAHKAILDQILKAIISGASLSEAMHRFSAFSDYEYYSIKIGEETGTLTQVSHQLGDFFAHKNEQRRQLISALTYPTIILCTAILVVAFMLSYVVPMFQDIFKQQNVKLPGITKFIIHSSGFLKDYGWIFIVFGLVLVIGRNLFKSKFWFRKAKDQLVLKLPFVGEFVKTVYLSQFTQAVSLLTASKVPVVNSIQLVKQMISFYPLQTALNEAEAEILRGKTLSQSLEVHSLFDSKMIALIKVAEETNQNEFIFERLNSQYNLQVQQRSKLLSTVMEPIIILIVGVLVGVILIAMYLPMFKLSSVLG